MRALALIVAFVLGALSAPPSSPAQQPRKLPRIGILFTAAPSGSPPDRAFRQGLAERGYQEGRTIAFEFRSAAGRYDRLPELAAELVRLKVDIIFAPAEVAIRAVRRETTTIPILMAAIDYDPLETGLIRSIARPGGNVTGVFFRQLELSGKRLELLKEAVPGVSRVAVLLDSASKYQLSDTEGAARSLRIQLHALEMRTPELLDSTFAGAHRARVGGMIVFTSPVLYAERSRIADLAIRNRIATISPHSEFAEAGGLMSYGANLLDMFQKAAGYADKILKGARPADLPVDMPTRFELVVNLKTARALGLRLPQSILIRADRVIE